MTGPHRHLLGAMLAVVLLLPVACGGDEATSGSNDESSASEETDMDVEATEAALEELARQLESRDDVVGVTAQLDRSTGVALPSQLYVIAEVEHTDPAAARTLVEEIAGATWRSEVPSISTVVIDVASTDETMLVSSGDVFGQVSLDRGLLEERFGPREG